MVYIGLEFGSWFEVPWNSPCYQVINCNSPCYQVINWNSPCYQVINWNSLCYQVINWNSPCYQVINEEETTTTISRPRRILLIFSSEPPRNSRPLRLKRCLFVEHRLSHYFRNCLGKFNILFLPFRRQIKQKYICICKVWTFEKKII